MSEISALWLLLSVHFFFLLLDDIFYFNSLYILIFIDQTIKYFDINSGRSNFRSIRYL